MATVIGFSGADGDYVLAEEDIAAVAKLLSEADGLVEVSLVPAYGQSFSAGPAYVNPERVAYLRTAAG